MGLWMSFTPIKSVSAWVQWNSIQFKFTENLSVHTSVSRKRSFAFSCHFLVYLSFLTERVSGLCYLKG